MTYLTPDPAPRKVVLPSYRLYKFISFSIITVLILCKCVHCILSNKAGNKRRTFFYEHPKAQIVVLLPELIIITQAFLSPLSIFLLQQEMEFSRILFSLLLVKGCRFVSHQCPLWSGLCNFVSRVFSRFF